MKYCGISRPDVDVSLPNVNVWPARAAQPLGIVERLQPGSLVRDEEAVEVGVDVALGDRGGALDPIASLHAGQTTIHARWMSPISNARTTAV